MKQQKLLWIRLSLLCAALCLIGLGAARGEVQTVLTKATRICMECIGLG